MKRTATLAFLTLGTVLVAAGTGCRGAGPSPADRPTPVAGKTTAAPGSSGPVTLRAHGSNPSWFLEITASRITLREPGARIDSIFPPVQPTTSGTRRRWSSAGFAPAPRIVEISVEERPCTDPLTGQAFPFAAEVNLEGQILTGCAVEGPPAGRPAIR